MSAEILLESFFIYLLTIRLLFCKLTSVEIIRGGKMSIILWHNSYSIGVDLLDQQHKILLNNINELYEAQKTSTSQAVIKDVIKKLYDYTVFHFKNEEEMQIGCNYDKYDKNKKEHEFFISKINEFSKDFQNNNLLLSLKTLDFLKDWMISHILGTDKEFGEFLRIKKAE